MLPWPQPVYIDSRLRLCLEVAALDVATAACWDLLMWVQQNWDSLLGLPTADLLAHLKQNFT